jgi:hypothetical protein
VIVSNKKLKATTTDGELLKLWRPYVGNIVTAAMEEGSISRRWITQ